MFYMTDLRFYLIKNFFFSIILSNSIEKEDIFKSALYDHTTVSLALKKWSHMALFTFHTGRKLVHTVFRKHCLFFISLWQIYLMRH